MFYPNGSCEPAEVDSGKIFMEDKELKGRLWEKGINRLKGMDLVLLHILFCKG